MAKRMSGPETLEAANDTQSGAARPGRPSAADAERLNERILAAAYDEFLETGFAESSIERIAARSNTTRRSIVARYATKTDLLVAVVSREIDRQRVAFDLSDDSGDDPLERLREGLWTLMQHALAPRALAINRISSDEMHKTPALSQFITSAADDLIKQIAVLFIGAQRAGMFTRYSANTLAYYTFSIVVQNSVTRAMLGDQSFTEPLGRELHFSDAWSFIASMA